jgi:type IV secretion system protein VirB8
MKKQLSNFHNRTNEWRSQIYYSQTVWLNHSMVGLIILSALLLLSLSANVLLIPLKQKFPYLYTLNETTGELTQLGNYQADKSNQAWLMTRFLLIRYVVNRESYDVDNIDDPYQIAWAMSDDAIAKTYADSVRTDNANSPYSIYGKDKFITVHVLAVNQLNDETAAVRFGQILHDRGSDTSQTIDKEAIIKWQYTSPDTTEKMLDRDPLGFKVTYYQPTQFANSTVRKTMDEVLSKIDRQTFQCVVDGFAHLHMITSAAVGDYILLQHLAHLETLRILYPTRCYKNVDQASLLESIDIERDGNSFHILIHPRDGVSHDVLQQKLASLDLEFGYDDNHKLFYLNRPLTDTLNVKDTLNLLVKAGIINVVYQRKIDIEDIERDVQKNKPATILPLTADQLRFTHFTPTLQIA